jgi:hypothetical protein
MIVFELICPDHHRFEGWFASAEDFDGQKARGLLSCPSCSSQQVEKLLTAKIGRSSEAAQPPSRDLPVASQAAVPAQQQQVNLHALIDYVLKNTENVGDRFVQEVRAMHKEEAPARPIRGTATPKEAEELLDEGIPLLPLPIPPKGEFH